MSRAASALAVALLAVTALVGAQILPPDTAQAQDAPAGQVPTQDIIPEPNSGEAPDEAGDRGGALQLLVLGLVVVAIGGTALHLARQARRADAG